MTTITTLNIRHGGGSRTNNIVTTLRNVEADIIVLTEYRNNENGEIIKKALESFGFKNLYATTSDSKINSVLIASRLPFHSQTFAELGDHSQRVIKITTNRFTLFGTYFPNGKDKIFVFDFLIKYIDENPKEKIIITGDINTGKHFIDEEGATFIHPKYLDKLEQMGFIDAWRFIHNDKKEFTWYSNAGNGFRLDHFLVHNELKRKIKNCFYNHETRITNITDHSMMTLELD